MAWLTGLAAVAVIMAAVSWWKIYQLKKDSAIFADRIERALDSIISGKEPADIEEAEDTLLGKTGEKLKRVNRIWQKKEEESVREKELMKGLISDISHQTKTPMANIKIYLEFLQEENLSEKGNKFLENLGGQVQKLDFLIQSMVKMSRLETGIICIQSRQANLYETLGQAVAAIVPAAAEKQIELYVDCASDISLCYDKKWTEEAIFNILDNAVKYTKSGGSIHVSVTRQEIFTRISIQDSGKGIPLERQAEIFTRFYREPEVHDETGIGIGLYLSRKILELQNGYIEVHAEPGQGSVFHLYLLNS